MREILFRGKRIDNGEWEEGDLLNKCSGSPKISIHGEYNRGLFVVDSYEVIPETVCQFTGLCDKNGKRIFENDIVIQKHRLNQGKETVKGVIVFGKNAQFLIRHKIQKGFDKDKIRNYSIWADCEIIGNKFDNPELLEKGGA